MFLHISFNLTNHCDTVGAVCFNNALHHESTDRSDWYVWQSYILCSTSKVGDCVISPRSASMWMQLEATQKMYDNILTSLVNDIVVTSKLLPIRFNASNYKAIDLIMQFVCGSPIKVYTNLSMNVLHWILFGLLNTQLKVFPYICWSVQKHTHWYARNGAKPLVSDSSQMRS